MTERRKTIIFILFLLTVISLKSFLFRFDNLDEIWHYNLCRGITFGALPYRDINIVGMPLYYFIFALPLFITRKLFAYRIAEVILIFLCSMMIFFIVKKECGFGYAVVSALIPCIFTDITSYNNLLFLFVLLLYIVNKLDSSFKRNLLLGILTALAVWSRQTTGFIVLIAEIIYLIIESRKNKTKLQGIIHFSFGFIGINLIFLIYLLATSTFFAFWDYCFFGLVNYSNVLDQSDLWGIPMVVMVTVLLIAECFLLMKQNFLRTLNHFLLTLALLTVSIPTIDMSHTIFAFSMVSITFMWIVKLNISSTLKPYIGWGAAAVLVITIVKALIPLFNNISFDSNCSELYLIPMNGAETGFVAVNDRNQIYKAQGYDVIVLSSCSAIISIYDGTFNPPYDLFLVGSFGTHDPVDIVRDICGKDKTIIVMPDDYNDECWMNPRGVYECVVEHCTPIDQVGRFVYYVPN